MQEPTTPPTNEPSVDDIIAQLDRPYSAGFPEDAIRAAQRQPEAITPRLIELIRSATATTRAGEFVKRNGHFFGLYLLAEFQAKEALPAIIEAISLPGEAPFDLFSDAITEDLSRILASLAADTLPIIDELIANRSLNEFVRSAASGAYIYLVRDGRLSRDQAVERLREHLKTALANQDADMAGALVADLAPFAPIEALEEIEQAFRDDLIDPFFVNEDYVNENIDGGEMSFQRRIERCKPTVFQDTVEELKEWYTYHSENTRSETDPDDDWDDPVRYVLPRDIDSTIRNDAPKVGRNDPCPCGSGKKFKKCCGSAY